MPPTSSDDPPPKKRVSLRVVQETPKTLLERMELGTEGAGSDRSPWSWVLLGALAHFAVLVPLAMIAMAVLRAMYQRASPSVVPLVVASILSVSAASLAGGYLVGRFGGRAGAREGALSGVAAGVVLWGVSRLPTGFVIMAVTAPAAWLGARWGRRARTTGDHAA